MMAEEAAAAAAAITVACSRRTPDSVPAGEQRQQQQVGATLQFEAGTSVCQQEGHLLTHLAASNLLEQQLRLSSAALTGSGCAIPAIDAKALQDLAALALQVAAQVDELLRSVHGRLQVLTALSVGCIQTYRNGVESLGEAVDTSIRAMYTLMARCEELDQEMQSVPVLARDIRDMKSALERLEGLCK